MPRKVVCVALGGATGRMGYRQHLVRPLLAIAEQGGVRLSSLASPATSAHPLYDHEDLYVNSAQKSS